MPFVVLVVSFSHSSNWESIELRDRYDAHNYSKKKKKERNLFIGVFWFQNFPKWSRWWYVFSPSISIALSHTHILSLFLFHSHRHTYSPSLSFTCIFCFWTCRCEQQQYNTQPIFFYSIEVLYTIVLVTPSRCSSTPKFICLAFVCSILFFSFADVCKNQIGFYISYTLGCIAYK